MSNNSKAKIPALRFPEFASSGEWQEYQLSEMLSFGNGKDYKHLKVGNIPVYGSGGYMTSVDQYLYDGESVCIGRKGTIDRPMFLSGKFWTVDTLFFTHTFINCIPKFVYSLFQNIDWLKHNEAGGVPSLSKSNLEKIRVSSTKIPEQQKIADCLSSLDELILEEVKKYDSLKEHKKGLMQKLFPVNEQTVPELRFPEFAKSDEWKKKILNELLDYERPEDFIVNSTDYKSVGTPVLTANKSFILGYTDENFGVYKQLPAIIFDDFTVDNKYVNFPFKIKSSAIKILKAKGKNELKFIFELLQLIKFDPSDHKRYYISVYQYLGVSVPLRIEEQQKIADCLSSLDELIAAQAKKIETLKLHKKALMQGLFPTNEEN